MTDKNQENFFSNYFNSFININELNKNINQQLEIIKEELKSENEINENASKILFNLDSNNFEVKENLRLLDNIYSKIEKIYKPPINEYECKNRKLININKYIKFKVIKKINDKISENKQNILFLNCKKISKWKNNLIIFFTLGFYNKNKSLNKKVQKLEETNKSIEKYLLDINDKKNENEIVIKNNMKELKTQKQKFNLVKQRFDECIFNFTKIQEVQALSMVNTKDMIKFINSLQEPNSMFNCKSDLPKL